MGIKFTHSNTLSPVGQGKKTTKLHSDSSRLLNMANFLFFLAD
jgi:hypothetical protein